MRLSALKQNIIFKNAFYLSVIQIFNYIFPLLTIPYLVKVLGAECFGTIALSQVVVSQICVLCDYGFNMSVTKDISLNKRNSGQVNKIFSSVIYLKGLIAIVAIAFTCVGVMLIPAFNAYRDVYFISLLYVIGQVIFPTWLFQGMEQMGVITLFNSIFKILFTVAVFLFIHSKSDIDLVAWIYAAGSVVSGILAFFFALHKYNITLIKVEIAYIKTLLVEGFDIFIPSFFANILSSGGVLVLGVFYSPQLVGYYSAIDKIVKAGIALLSTVTQAMFPNIAYQFSVDRKAAIKSIIKIAKLVIGLLLVILFVMFFASGYLLKIVYSKDYVNYAYVLNILLVWGIIGFINNFLGIQFLIGSGQSKYYRKSFLLSGLFMIISFLTIKYWAINGVLFSMMLGEVLLTFFMIYYIRKLKLHVA